MKMHPTTLILASLLVGTASVSIAQEQPAPAEVPAAPAPPEAPPPPPPPEAVPPSPPPAPVMAPLASAPPPPPRAVYPPCSRTLQDECTNTRPESDTKGGPPAHKPRRRAH